MREVKLRAIGVPDAREWSINIPRLREFLRRKRLVVERDNDEPKEEELTDAAAPHI